MRSLPPSGREVRPAVSPAHEPRGGRLAGSPAGRSDDGPGANDLHYYIDVLRRRWKLVAAVATVIVVAVGIGTVLQEPTYRASGLIELRGQSSEGVAVDELFQAQRLSNQFLETQYGVMRSPALAQRAMMVAGILDSATIATAAAVQDSAVVLKRRVDAFARGLLVVPTGGSNLVWVHYESPDPRLAADAVNAVFESYTAMRAEAARTTVTTLAGEVSIVRDRLSTAERELIAFARENGLTVGRGGDSAEDLPHARVRILQQQLAEADADRYASQSLYDLVSAQGEGLLESEILQTLEVRLATLRGEHARLQATFLDDYPQTRELKAQIDEVEALLARERGRLRDAISDRYQAAVRRQQLLQMAVNQQRALVDSLGERNAEYGIRARDVAAQQELYARLHERLRAAEVSAAVATTDVNVVQAAIAPSRPVSPDMSTNLVLAAIAGMMLGVGVAFARDLIDVTVRTAGDIDALAVPLLGMIPSAHGIASTSPNGTTARYTGRLALPRAVRRGREPEFDERALKDAFLGLRTSVLMGDGPTGGAMRSILITSARPGDGKTTIAVNLAMSLGLMGRRVLLVDADLRKPAVHRLVSLRRGAGVAEYLRGEQDWRSLVYRQENSELDILLAGERLDDPTNLLASSRLQRLLDDASSEYDCVIFDSPAVGINAADTRIVSSLVDGVVMVLRSGSTPRALVPQLVRQVPNLVGIVLNDVDPEHFPDYYYSYGEAVGHAVAR